MQLQPAPQEVFPIELLATVGHEFRGPLTTIQGYATTLLRHEGHLSPSERQEFLHAIREASAHLSRLVDRFLELAQLESHLHAFTPVPVDLLALAQEAMTALQQSRSHHLLLTPSASCTSTSRGQPLPEREAWTLLGDRRLLRTMLDVLLENAIAYSAPESLVEVTLAPLAASAALAALQDSAEPERHRTLIVPARFRSQEAVLALHVRDHGIGIASGHLGRIFERFYRVDSSLTRTVNGLGLGLALCRAIVVLHGGLLQVESVLGEGSTFSIVLPCASKVADKRDVRLQRRNTYP